MAICTCMKPELTLSLHSADTWRPLVSCNTSQRGRHLTVCGSKTSRKQSKGFGSPDQRLKDRESPASDALTNTQSKGKEELTRSGQPVGWKILPREDLQPPPVPQEVSSETPAVAFVCNVGPYRLCLVGTEQQRSCQSHQMHRMMGLGVLLLETRCSGPAHQHPLSYWALHGC